MLPSLKIDTYCSVYWTEERRAVFLEALTRKYGKKLQYCRIAQDAGKSNSVGMTISRMTRLADFHVHRTTLNPLYRLLGLELPEMPVKARVRLRAKEIPAINREPKPITPLRQAIASLKQTIPHILKEHGELTSGDIAILFHVGVNASNLALNEMLRDGTVKQGFSGSRLLWSLA